MYVKKLQLVLILSLSLWNSQGQTIEKYSQLVNPFIGTGGHGHTYPGATLPFGMVQLSPDTRLTGWDGCSGYHYSDSIIYGFSHTHLSGTGVSDYGDILLMPFCGESKWNSGYQDEHIKTDNGYGSVFRKETEKASPGYYAVTLDKANILVELTATLRTGFHKYIFPKKENAQLLLDLIHRDEVLNSTIHKVSEFEIEGSRISRSWAQEQHIYFVIRFEKPIHTFQINPNGIVSEITHAQGKQLQAIIEFGELTEPLLVKVGISAVDMAGARNNLELENPGWNFEHTRSMAETIWNENLGKIEIEKGQTDDLIIFYTALYHSLLAPNIYHDLDGRYRGTDLKIHNDTTFSNYTVFSLWDTYRATHPLFTIIERKRTQDFIHTFLHQYQQSGKLPVWELSGNCTGCMIGYHSVPVIVDAWVNGIRGFDPKLALQSMVKSATMEHLGLPEYQACGYIPSNKEAESVSKTLEYAYDDWCISEFARMQGELATQSTFLYRAQSYKNLYNPSTGFMQPKIESSWKEKFDPSEVDFNYTEANSWQYSFYVPHDIQGLILLSGGNHVFEEKLDALFSASDKTTGRQQADITGLIGQYAHGNEPSHHMAYLYNFIGKPNKTQKMVDKIMKTMYRNAPDGLSGNEDCGQMSAWYVLSALGFYPVTPGSGYYVLGAPYFPRVDIHLENGKKFSIIAQNKSEQTPFVGDRNLNGKTYPNLYLSHHEILKGGYLQHQMDSQPDHRIYESENLPFSSIIDSTFVAVPFMKTDSIIFSGSQLVELLSIDPKVEIWYKTQEDRGYKKFESPIVIDTSLKLQWYATKQLVKSKIAEASFHRIPNNWQIQLQTSFHKQYTAGGNRALIDGRVGGNDFRLGEWQGYYGVNLEAIVDLGNLQPVRQVKINFLQDVNSWIFMPSKVQVLISSDGIHFSPSGTITTHTREDDWKINIEPFLFPINGTSARFVKVIGYTNTYCPAWHKGAGNLSFIFADEIQIE